MKMKIFAKANESFIFHDSPPSHVDNDTTDDGNERAHDLSEMQLAV